MCTGCRSVGVAAATSDVARPRAHKARQVVDGWLAGRAGGDGLLVLAVVVAAGVEEVDVLGEAAAALLGDTDACTGDTDACQQSFVP